MQSQKSGNTAYGCEGVEPYQIENSHLIAFESFLFVFTEFCLHFYEESMIITVYNIAYFYLLHSL